MKTVRVVLADDHPVIRSGIRAILVTAPDIQVVGEASNGKEALELVQKEHPDILIADARMPEMDGPTLVNTLRESQLPVRVLILSGFNESQYIYALFASGVSGYLLKDEAGEKIIEAVRGIASGDNFWVSNSIASKMTWQTKNGLQQPQPLTRREGQVLKAVSEGKTNQEIAYSMGISEKTVEKHLMVVLGKLGVENRVAAAVLAVRQGLFKDDPN